MTPPFYIGTIMADENYHIYQNNSDGLIETAAFGRVYQGDLSSTSDFVFKVTLPFAGQWRLAVSHYPLEDPVVISDSLPEYNSIDSPKSRPF